jgi:AraC-like DNA-binding protein
MFPITRYSTKNADLKPWVKFYWHLETESEVTVNHKLLPTDSIDIILNRSDTIEYLIGKEKFIPDCFHFNGIRDRCGHILQQGRLNVFGISFEPFGLYPVLQQPLSDCTNRVVDLKSVSEELQQRFELVFQEEAPAEDTIRMLESELAGFFNITETDRTAAALLERFFQTCSRVSIGEFCSEQSVNGKTFERLCLKYTGYSPKRLQRLTRFRNASNQLMNPATEDKLTWIAFDNDYYDQAHFIKDFREFSGKAPGRFIKDKNTVKENTEYKYR